MEPLDNEFFEKYKSLERLCSDMYSCKNGVSLYIEDMESRSPRETSSISSWDTDYKLLKHLRWIRNRIAHDTGNYQICSISDIQEIQEFYERILSGRDSIALLEKSKTVGNQPKEKKQAVNDQENIQYEHRLDQQISFDPGCLIMAAVITVLFIVIIAVTALLL